MFIGKSSVQLSRKLKYLSLGVIAGLALAGFSGINLLFAAPPPGTGLEATYFNESNLTDPGANRTDPTINFNWGTGPPIPNVVYGNTFSVRWTGHIRAEKTETYTFYTMTDDGVRLWVNGQLLVDKWVNQTPAAEWSGGIALVAGQSYDITMEYYENTQQAVAQLRWSSPTTPKNIVPQSVLYTPGTAPSAEDIDYVTENQTVSPANPEVGQTVSFAADVRNQGTTATPTDTLTTTRIDINNDGSFDVTLTDQTTSALAAGVSETENWTDSWTAIAGTHLYEVCADSGEVMLETNETNNCSVGLFVVSEPPPPPFVDYIVEAPQTTPSNTIEGQTMSFSGAVKNIGSIDSAAVSEAGLRLDIDDDGTYDLTFTNQPTPVLSSGASELMSWTDVWTATLGTHRLEICADVLADVSESDDANNCSTLQFTVNPPPPPPAADYISESLATSPITPLDGQSVSFGANIRNQGNAGSTTASEVSLRLDIGDDGSYDLNFANLPTSALAAGSMEAVNWVDSWTAQTGSHRLEICADVGGAVGESDETNNCATQMFAVNPDFPPPPPPGSQIILVDQVWICSGPVDIGLVKVTINTLDKDAISLRNCSGHIGRIEVETATSDGIKGANSPNYWPHDLVVDSGYVRCTNRLTEAHQDAISIMGGRDITFNNFAIECGNMADPFPGGAVSAFSASKGGAGATTPTRIVCDHCIFMSGASNTVVLNDSIESGVRNSVVCEDRTPGSGRWSTNANTINYLNINNEEPLGTDPRCIDFMTAWMWAWSGL